MDRWIVRPFLAVFAWCNRMEQSWTSFLGGEKTDCVPTTAKGELKS
jgi:hypothetical protein